ncbi:MAG: heme-binding protein [Thaumarchaeota archaeon]|nr:heme-binding protein [Nitrososphaerota archaeon]
MRTASKLTLDDVKIILEGAQKKATEMSVEMDIAVVDEGGHLLGFYRMDKAKITSIDIAINKAFTAACSRRPTHEYQAVAQPGAPAYGVNMSNQGRFMIVGGGLPITAGDEVVGGIGTSSGKVEQDMAVAQAGIDAFHSYVQK